MSQSGSTSSSSRSTEWRGISFDGSLTTGGNHLRKPSRRFSCFSSEEGVNDSLPQKPHRTTTTTTTTSTRTQQQEQQDAGDSSFYGVQQPHRRTLEEDAAAVAAAAAAGESFSSSFLVQHSRTASEEDDASSSTSTSLIQPPPSRPLFTTGGQHHRVGSSFDECFGKKKKNRATSTSSSTMQDSMPRKPARLSSRNDDDADADGDDQQEECPLETASSNCSGTVSMTLSSPETEEEDLLSVHSINSSSLLTAEDNPPQETMMDYYYHHRDREQPSRYQRGGGRVLFDLLPSSARRHLQKVAEACRHGIAVRTHIYLFKKYEKSFVGSQAVTFMVDNGMAATREDAVFLGQRLLQELQLFFHVCWDHTFKDGHYFYRFTDNNSSNNNTTDYAGGGGDSSTASQLPAVPPASQNSVPCHQELTGLSNQDEAPEVPKLRVKRTESWSALLKAIHISQFARRDLKRIAKVFQRDILTSTHTYHFKRYKDTFVGREAVDYMVTSKMATSRNDAVFLGQRLLDLNLFHHVCNDHQFKDAYLFYRYDSSENYENCTAACTSSNSTSTKRTSLSVQKEQSLQRCRSNPSVYSSSKGFERPSPIRQLSQPRCVHSVSFDTIRERCYERILDVHPSTSSGPSVGLGWRYIEKAPQQLTETENNIHDNYNTRRTARDFQLSGEVRKEMLRQLGYTKKQLLQAARLNEKIRDQRKQTLNNLTARTMAAGSDKRHRKVGRRIFRLR